MGVTTPTRKQTTGAQPAPAPISDLALQLWVLALLIAQILVACWWFGRMYTA